jgi:hypothetical protein
MTLWAEPLSYLAANRDDTRSYNATTGQIVSQSQANQTTVFEYYAASHQTPDESNRRRIRAAKRFILNTICAARWSKLGRCDLSMEYVFDSYGQRSELHTYRGGKGWQLASFPASTAGTVDATKWIYHESTGLLIKRKTRSAGR